LLKPSEYRHMGGGVWPNRRITFIEAKKAEFTVYFALFTVYVEEWDWLKTSYRGRGLAAPLYGRGGLKLLKKTVIR